MSTNAPVSFLPGIELTCTFDALDNLVCVENANFLRPFLARLPSPPRVSAFLTKFAAFCNSHVEPANDLIACCDELCASKVALVRSEEISVLVLFAYRMQRARDKCLWVKVDLPPGVGKTFEVERLYTILTARGDAMLITTPTAKTALAFENARTLHSQFQIPVKKVDRASVHESLKLDNVQRKLTATDVFYFDEFSMYSAELVYPILHELMRRKKFCVITGDSCQMPPVNAAPIRWSHVPFPFVFRAEPHADILIRRFADPTSPLRKFILDLRELIGFVEESKHDGGKSGKVQFPLTRETLDMWLPAFAMFNVSESLTVDTILRTVETRQLQVCAVVDRLRDAGLYEAMTSSATEDWTRFDASELRQEAYPIVVGYQNAFSLEVAKYVLHKGGIDTSRNYYHVSAASAAKKARADGVISNVFVDKNNFLAWHMAHIEKLVAPNVLDKLNVFYPGMFIKCRENDRLQRVHNGLTGIFLGFRVRQDAFAYLRETRFSNAATVARGSLASNDTVTVFVAAAGEDAVLEAQQAVSMVFYDLDAGRIREIKPTVKYLCDNCERRTCVHHTAGAAPRFLCFNWATNYAQTIFNLQGTTLKNEQMYLVASRVLKNNLLKTLYIVLSRCTSPAQIVIDKEFVIKSLRAIFNVKEARIEKFMVAQKMTIETNHV